MRAEDARRSAIAGLAAASAVFDCATAALSATAAGGGATGDAGCTDGGAGKAAGGGRLREGTAGSNVSFFAGFAALRPLSVSAGTALGCGTGAAGASARVSASCGLEIATWRCSLAGGFTLTDTTTIKPSAAAPASATTGPRAIHAVMLRSHGSRALCSSASNNWRRHRGSSNSSLSACSSASASNSVWFPSAASNSAVRSSLESVLVA